MHGRNEKCLQNFSLKFIGNYFRDVLINGMLTEKCMSLRTGFSWLIKIQWRLLWTRQWTFEFHKKWGISWPAGQLVNQQSGPKSVNVTVQYLKLHSHILRLGVILKGCAIHCVNQKPFEIYCAILIQCAVNCRVVNNKMAAVASGWTENEERGFILECVEVYKPLPAYCDVKSREYSNRQTKRCMCHFPWQIPIPIPRSKQKRRNQKM